MSQKINERLQGEIPGASSVLRLLANMSDKVDTEASITRRNGLWHAEFRGHQVTGVSINELLGQMIDVIMRHQLWDDD